MTDAPIVFVIDDDVSVRDAVAGVMKSVGLRVQTFESAQAFMEAPATNEISCLVLDVRLPGLSGLDFQRRLAESGIETPIIFLTGYGDIPMTVRAMKAGAVEFLTKPFRDQDLIDAIGQALGRDRELRSQRAEIAAIRLRFDALTPRERQVMAMVVLGKMNKEIASELGTSEITVKVQRGSVMRKMEADSVVDLVRLAERLKIATRQTGS